MPSQVNIAAAKKYLTESFDEFPGIDIFINNLAILFDEAEARGAASVAGASSAGTSASKGKGKGNPYAIMLKIVCAIATNKSQAVVDMANAINVVTCNNIKGPATRELYDSSAELQKLAASQSMTLLDLVMRARGLGKNTGVASIVYGILSAEAVSDIIEKCLPLCPQK